MHVLWIGADGRGEAAGASGACGGDAAWSRVELPPSGIAIARASALPGDGAVAIALLPARKVTHPLSAAHAAETPRDLAASCGLSSPSSSTDLIALLIPIEQGLPARAALISELSLDDRADAVRDARETHALTVNGLPPLPVAILVDGDEIAVAGSRLRLAAYEAVAPTAWTAPVATARCARCGDELHAGDRTIACPACAAWHHEGALAEPAREERGCWTYDPRCGACGRERGALLARESDAAARDVAGVLRVGGASDVARAGEEAPRVGA